MAERITLDHFKATDSGEPIYAIGLADNLVTIRSQQLRAICLAELLHSATPTLERKNIAIIGGGIAGLTLSARLLQLGWMDIRIFERLTDLLAVQNGCDTRWIHPQIIDWPLPESKVDMSDLPILNWTTDTASNVSYEIEAGWQKIVDSCAVKPSNDRGSIRRGKFTRTISVLLGVTHLKISMRPSSSKGRKRIKDHPVVEWIRDTKVSNRKIDGDTAQPSGQESFSKVILATGFGIETGTSDSYWRNESLGQLNIDGAQRRFLVSGLGDGAISDLLRLTTKNFRPDRVVNELSLSALEGFLRGQAKNDLLKTLESLTTSRKQALQIAKHDLHELIDYFSDRKRDDTYVVLHAIGRLGFREAFRQSKASTLNKVFLYVLYKNGAFQYVESAKYREEEVVAANKDVPAENIIRRHGVDRAKVVSDLFATYRIASGREYPKVFLREQATDCCEQHIKAQATYQRLVAALAAFCRTKSVVP
ncbi:hypothetical protein [Paucibacter sp. Y2R2-4]|uniref:hypothetical protein n=1 Tax=Paucibacter sp. Y2R2-4 TaxID=2893553 RepID=UPI0021E3E9A7|nr:hypothetical protein [Paucibacter sp. Y2R2-4]MCV2350811.1 hypothetical protein [Paucibacter sp. Y2R2-4]